MALLSIVLPAYNEEQNIANTTEVLTGVLEENKIEYELIFISDGSVDGTFDAIQREAEKNPRIKGAEFSRNFGKEAGIFAGLELTTGDAVIDGKFRGGIYNRYSADSDYRRLSDVKPGDNRTLYRKNL